MAELSNEFLMASRNSNNHKHTWTPSCASWEEHLQIKGLQTVTNVNNKKWPNIQKQPSG